MGDAGEMTHDEMIHDYAAEEMVAAADSDQVDGDGESDSDCHDVAAVLFDNSNNIDSSNMDSYIYSKSHHD